MKIHRFYCQFEEKNNKIKIGDKGQIRQLRNVLRLAAGDRVVVFSNNGADYLCEIASLSGDGCELSILEVQEAKQNILPRIWLFCSVLKKENFELVVQKATELGVSRIIPIICERTVKTGLNQERLEKIALEAIEQSGQNSLPQIDEPIDLQAALSLAAACELNILLNMASEKIKQVCLDAKQLSLFVGPEGGWTESEVEKMKHAGFIEAAIAPSTLRAETAAIAGLGAIVSRF